jgi:dihydropyrimidinase
VQRNILIKNSVIVTHSETFSADLLIEDGIIKTIAKNIPKSRAEMVIDAEGKYLLPGGVDVHTHLEMPFMGTVTSDDFETGTLAAACGGTTTIIDFAIQEKGKSLKEALRLWQEKARKGVIDYGLHLAITSWDKSTEDELPSLIKEGVTSFKVFMAYKGSLQLKDSQIFQILKILKREGALLMIHCENGDLIDLIQKNLLLEGKTQPKFHELSRPAILEEEAVFRAISFAKLVDHPIYIVHLSSKEALQRVKEAQLRGFKVYAETCPHYLLFSKEKYYQTELEAAKFIFSPPLREKEDNRALWEGLKDKVLQVISTDHCAFNLHGQKDLSLEDFSKIPNGCPGVEDRLKLIYTYGVLEGNLSINRFVDLVSTAPAKLFGIFPQKGTICVGSDADLVLFDPQIESNFSAAASYQRCDYNTYEGLRFRGSPKLVISRGEIIFKDGIPSAKKGRGKFLKRKLPYLF